MSELVRASEASKAEAEAILKAAEEDRQAAAALLEGEAKREHEDGFPPVC